MHGQDENTKQVSYFERSIVACARWAGLHFLQNTDPF